jgi:hypothetical protein
MKKLTLLGIVVGAGLLSIAPLSIQQTPKKLGLYVDKAEAQYYRSTTEGHIGERITAPTAPMDIRPTPTAIPTATGIDHMGASALALALVGGSGDPLTPD